MDNIGYNGGALSLCEGSKIVIGRQAQLNLLATMHIILEEQFMWTVQIITCSLITKP